MRTLHTLGAVTPGPSLQFKIVLWLVAIAMAAGLRSCEDRRIRREAVARAAIAQLEKQVARQDSVIAQKDSALRVAYARTDTVTKVITRQVTAYKEVREQVDIDAEIAGVPEGMVLVPKALVVAADSMAKLIPTMAEQMAAERRASEERFAAVDSANTLLRAEVQQLKLLDRSRPGILDDAKKVGAALVILYVGKQIYDASN